ncbi:SGNH/GDSL hydrolase family protein [Pseudonocardia sp. TRM90224]|uniref:SGNH/GDSL hydrolase family protein n=1 Tax=Pseudonocardia sp. TRM90224 TaxID=2812678 RepID=UPI001E42A085|nr:SGNH/GDSL hydrolase family protein [Pseudonocardia sp. TRM90224]
MAVAIAIAVTLGVGCLTGAADAAPGDRYVALGDSYAAGPVLQPQVLGQPYWCSRSQVNYPALTAQALELPLADVTCSGAKSGDVVARQLGELTAETSLVTLTIGANDVQCSGLCQWQPGGLQAAVDNAAATKWGPLLDDIRRRAPKAQILVVGYGMYVPAGACPPSVAPWVGAVVQGPVDLFNAAMAAQADARGITFVDTHGPSAEHTACVPPGERWFEPETSASDAAKWHPTHAGMSGISALLVERLRAAG